jgi:hypothetical protein
MTSTIARHPPSAAASLPLLLVVVLRIGGIFLLKTQFLDHELQTVRQLA